MTTASSSWSLSRHAANTIALLGVEASSRAATFAVYALVARYLGVRAMGQMALAFTLFYVFQMLANAGLRSLLIRAVAKEPAAGGAYLVSGAAVSLGASLLSLGLLALFVEVAGYSADGASVVLLLALGLPPAAATMVCDAILQARDRLHLSAMVQFPVQILKTALVFLLLSRGADLRTVVLVLVAAQVVVVAVEAWLLLRLVGLPAWRALEHLPRRMLTTGVTFLGIDALTAVASSSGLVLLSVLGDEHEVGLLSAAFQVLVPLTVVYYNLVLGAFPVMCRAGSLDVGALKRIADHLMVLLVALSVPVVAGVYFLGEPVLALMYGRADFAAAAGALRLLSWTLPLVALTHVLGHALVASGRERTTLRIVVASLVLNLLAGTLLIVQFGLMGAAMMMLLARIIDFVLHAAAVSRVFSRFAIPELIWVPLAASTCMAAGLALAPGQHVIAVAASAAVLYGVVLVGLLAWATGGPSALKARCLELVSR